MKEDKKNTTIDSKRLFAKALGKDVPLYDDNSHPSQTTRVDTSSNGIENELEKEEKTSKCIDEVQNDISTSEKTLDSSVKVGVQNKKYSPNNRLLWLLVPLLLILLIAAFMLGLHWQNISPKLVVEDKDKAKTTSVVDVNEPLYNSINSTGDTSIQSSVNDAIAISDTIHSVANSIQTANSNITDTLATKVKIIDEALTVKLPLDFFQEERLFVSCFAMKKETNVLKKIAYIQSKGYKHVHYYWIPDVQPDGNHFFKIVVGPFTDITEAQAALTSLQQTINWEAYLLRVKKP